MSNRSIWPRRHRWRRCSHHWNWWRRHSQRRTSWRRRERASGLLISTFSVLKILGFCQHLIKILFADKGQEDISQGGKLNIRIADLRGFILFDLGVHVFLVRLANILKRN